MTRFVIDAPVAIQLAMHNPAIPWEIARDLDWADTYKARDGLVRESPRDYPT